MSNGDDKDQCAQNKSSFGKRCKAPGRVSAMRRERSRTLTHTHGFDRGRKRHQHVQTYFSIERFSKWLRRRQKEADPDSPLRSASFFTLEGRRTWSARAWVCVRGTERGVRQRVREGDRDRRGEREALLVCAALLPGREVLRFQRASVRLRLLLTAGKTPAKDQAEAHMKDTPRRCVTGPRVR